VAAKTDLQWQLNDIQCGWLGPFIQWRNENEETLINGNEKQPKMK
jgi:hypothetical protein